MTSGIKFCTSVFKNVVFLLVQKELYYFYIIKNVKQ